MTYFVQSSNSDENTARMIAQIHHDCWHKHYKGLLPDELIATRTYPRLYTFWRDYLANSKTDVETFTALERSDVIGFCSVLKNIDGPRRYEIKSLHVDTQHQRKGIGTELTQAALSSFCGEKYFLQVIKENDSAIAFYKRLGLKVLGEALAHDVPHLQMGN